MRWVPLLLLFSCSEMKMLSLDTGRSFGGALLDPESNQLRLDIYPSDATPTLDAQSWVANSETNWGDLDIEVLPSVLVQGSVVGYQATPFGAEVPGSSNVPVDANVALIRPGTLGGATTLTDESGRYTLRVPPARGYQLSVTPTEAALLPFHVETSLDLTEDIQLAVLDLGYGNPVWGKVLTSSGQPVPAASVQIHEPISSVTGAPTITDETGFFLLRSPSGTHQVQVSSDHGATLPTIRIQTLVLEDDGAVVSVDLGELNPVTVSGQVQRESNGRAVKDVKVRFTSDQLFESEGQLAVETETDRNGLYSRVLLPGEWLVEFIPPYEDAITPLQETLTIATDEEGVKMDDIILADHIRVETTVRKANGSKAPGVVVNAQELGFDRFIYTSTTDDEGRISIDVPAVPMAFMLVPRDSSHAVTHVLVDPTDSVSGLSLVERERVAGTISTVGDPVPFALIEIRDAHGNLYASAMTDGDGHFSVRVEATP